VQSIRFYTRYCGETPRNSVDFEKTILFSPHTTPVEDIATSLHMLVVRSLSRIAVLAVLISALVIIAIIVLASFWEHTREERVEKTPQPPTTPRATTSSNTGRSEVPLDVSKVSLFCENTDLTAGVVSGNCTIVVTATNKGVKPLHIYYLTFPDAGLRVFVEEVLKPGEEKNIVRKFYIINPTPLRQVLKGVLATDLGNIEVSIEVFI